MKNPITWIIFIIIGAVIIYFLKWKKPAVWKSTGEKSSLVINPKTGRTMELPPGVQPQLPPGGIPPGGINPPSVPEYYYEKDPSGKAHKIDKRYKVVKWHLVPLWMYFTPVLALR